MSVNIRNRKNGSGTGRQSERSGQGRNGTGNEYRNDGSDEMVYPQFSEQFRADVAQRIAENIMVLDRSGTNHFLQSSKGTAEIMEKSLRMVEKENVEQYPGLAQNHNWHSDSPPPSRSPSPRRSSPPCRHACSYLPRKICDEYFVAEKVKNPCLFCNGPHPADSCYKVVDVHERREFLKKSGRCLRCFRRHPLKACYQLVGYECKYCFDTDATLGPHHPAICLEAYPEFVKKEEDGNHSW